MPSSIGTDVTQAAAILRDGGLVAFATETVYGLGANALNARAVARIFEVKNRPSFDPIIVHIAELDQLPKLTRSIPARAEQLAARFWPGPLTMVLPKADIVPDIVTSGLSSVGVRMPDHPLALALLREAGLPVAAPSANPFGRISPTRAEHVAEMLGDRIDYILDGGPCRVGLESTVLDLTGDVPVLLRPGGLPVEEIEAVVGQVIIAQTSAEHSEAAMPAPGMLPRHYAPRTRLVIDARLDEIPRSLRRRAGFLAFRFPPNDSAYEAIEVLSPAGDLTEAAANFFAALRRLDALDLDLIVAESFPDHGLGRALNDRLRRAAQEE
ncbi:MAG: L-threonylcarbamoyladenylate synthase [Planctomycetaceae bacterium]